MLVLGMGIGGVMQVLVIIVQNAVPHSELGVATSGATFFRSIGGSFGTAIFGAIFSNVLVGNLTKHLHGVHLPAGFSSADATPALLSHLPAAVHAGFVAGYAESIQTVFIVAVPDRCACLPRHLAHPAGRAEEVVVCRVDPGRGAADRRGCRGNGPAADLVAISANSRSRRPDARHDAYALARRGGAMRTRTRGDVAMGWVSRLVAGSVVAACVAAVAPAAAVALAAGPAQDVKKGVAAWTFNGVDRALAKSGASWYYTWAPGHPGIASPRGVRFVPMIWGAGSVTTATLRRGAARRSLPARLQRAGQRRPVQHDRAARAGLWPRLMATGMKLGSPAVATDAATPGGWLDRFMRRATARGYRVNFIAVHWYGADFAIGAAVQQLKSYLQAIHGRYHLPIWLTEFALIRFGASASFPAPRQQAAFVTAAARMLRGLSFVQRYAWFALPATSGDGSAGLFRPRRGRHGSWPGIRGSSRISLSRPVRLRSRRHDGAGFPGRHRLGVVQPADHGHPPGRLHEPARGLDLRAHGAGRERACAQFARCRPADRVCPGRAVAVLNGVHVGQHASARRAAGRWASSAAVRSLSTTASTPRSVAGAVADHGHAPAAGADDDHAAADQQRDHGQVHKLSGLGRGHHPAPAVPVLADLPASLGGQLRARASS